MSARNGRGLTRSEAFRAEHPGITRASIGAVTYSSIGLTEYRVTGDDGRDGVTLHSDTTREAAAEWCRERGIYVASAKEIDERNIRDMGGLS